MTKRKTKGARRANSDSRPPRRKAARADSGVGTPDRGTPDRAAGTPGSVAGKPGAVAGAAASAPSGKPGQRSGKAEGIGSAPLRLLQDVVARARGRALERVEALRARYPGETRRQLSERLVRSSALRAGLVGAATGALSIVALPVGLPAGIALTLSAEAELLLALLHLHDVDLEGQRGAARLYALWLGAGVADAAKSAGLKLGANAAGRVLRGSLPARLLARLNPVLLRAILRRLGLGFLPRALKLWPLLGAPIGFSLDRAALKALGASAIATLEEMESRPRPARAASRPRTPKAR